MRAAMQKREAIQPRYYGKRKPMHSSMQQAARTGDKLYPGRFRRGQRAWRACKVSLVYLGDLTGSGQSGRSMQDVENQVCSKGLSEVGLSHSSDEAVETLWSEGDNKLTFALDKAYRALEARRV